ncbi:MAG: hypothetical protein BECKG1743D_GA0114223_107364 [Candidatus Kentron sp. G]|nr:MAG: hypothetical protein BECKG1743F_GA0114225_107324 [Candidatus Kentron sp. G]VFN04337.1 MAG: hypothetical protein BECKG1743E_GA0114224_107164 [Candidatus Kentron sp. G]VFN05561.1 MAG: hypothetical protein BECKG1743D_GA0114223_107364 [Candidatus Kentron sp. G]
MPYNLLPSKIIIRLPWAQTTRVDNTFRDPTVNTTQPWHDSIVEEIHATRERLAQQYHNDLAAYSRAAEAHCLALGFDFVETPQGATETARAEPPAS